MKQKMIKIGFSYFSFNDYLLDHQLALWFSAIQKWNASHVIFTGNFDIAITEDVFRKAQEFGLEPIVHFNTIVPRRESSMMRRLFSIFIRNGE